MNSRIQEFVTIAILMAFVSIPSHAKKPDSPGNSEKNQTEHHYDDNAAAGVDYRSYQGYFNDDRRALIRNYYVQNRDSGNCPPGLAKKNNGCQPPGQARKWQRGQPLPGDVVYYDLPAALLHQLGRTPEGQKIVRVGTDLLLISVGTGLVIDALDDLDDIF